MSDVIRVEPNFSNIRPNSDNFFPESLDKWPNWWEKDFWIYQSKGEVSYVMISQGCCYGGTDLIKNVSRSNECIAINSDLIPHLKNSRWWRNCQGSELPDGLNWPPIAVDVSYAAYQVNVDVNLKDIHQVVTIDTISQRLGGDQRLCPVGDTIVDFSYPSDNGYVYYHADLSTLNYYQGKSKCREWARNLEQASPAGCALVKSLMLHDLDGDKLLKGLIAQGIDINKAGKVKLERVYGAGWHLTCDGNDNVLFKLFYLVNSWERPE